MKKKLLAGVMAVALAAALGINSTSVSARESSQLFSVFVHLEYADGFSLDYPLARSVEMSVATNFLQNCGRAHRTPSVVLHYCFVVPE